MCCAVNTEQCDEFTKGESAAVLLAPDWIMTGQPEREDQWQLGG